MDNLRLQKELLHAITSGETDLFISICKESDLDDIALYKFNLNKLHQTCVHLACIYDRLEILNYVWDASEHDQSIFVLKDSCYKEPLHHACQHGNIKCVNWLLKYIDTININSMKKADWTSLMLVVVCKNKSMLDIGNIVDKLIKYGANVRLKNKDGWTALHLACKNTDVNVVKKLAMADHDCCTMTSNNGRSPLHTASFNGNLPIVKYLVSQFFQDTNIVDDCGMTPLMDALVCGHVELSKWLLDSTNACVQCYDRLGRHTMNVVCESGPFSSVAFLVNRLPDLVNVRTLHGNITPLMSAAKQKNIEVVNFLLNHGSDPSAVDDKGRSYQSFLS